MQLQCEKATALSAISKLLEYPTDDYLDNIKRARALINSVSPRSAKLLDQFEKIVLKQKLEELEEQFTRTFDIAPLCNLYTSAYIYGDESYDRGSLISALGSKFQELSFDPGNELPDHLAVLLKFSTCLTREELDELTTCCLIGPVKQMNDKLKNASNPFACLLKAILTLLKVALPKEC